MAEKLKLDLNSVAESAAVVLRTIEPLCNQNSSDPAEMQSVVRAMQEINNLFKSALSESVSTAKEGNLISSKCVTLCDCILSGESLGQGEMREYADNILETVRDAEKRAKATSAKFRKVRTALGQITNAIPADVSQLRDERNMAVFSAAIKGSLSIVTEAAGAVYATGAVVSGAMGLALLAADIVCPPLFVCSVIGGLVAWAARSNSKQLKGEAAEDFQRFLSYIDRVKQAEQIDPSLADAVARVDQVANWWVRMATLIETAIQSVPGPDQKVLRFDIIGAKREWTDVREILANYETKICCLEDSY